MWRRVILGLALVGVIFLLWPYSIGLLDRPHSIVIESADGKLLSAQIAEDGQWRFPMIEAVPERFAEAITAYEDSRYWYHPGIDPIALMRAIFQNIKNGTVVSGASTLTMQCVRLSYSGASRTWTQKLREMLLAIKLETQFSKKDILRLYATHAPFGGNVVGLEAAAWRYFERSPEDLSWAETATLAVLPNAPSLVTLEKNRERLQEKRNRLLLRLHEDDKLSKSDYELAITEPLIDDIYSLPRYAPHYLDWQRSQGVTGRITSDIDRELQSGVAEVLSQSYDRWSGIGIHNAAVLVMDNESQEIISYVGNIANTTEESAVDMVQARRSSGSILKPLLYAAMVDEGEIMPDQLLRDVPVSIDGFHPNNFHRSYSGAVPASIALSRSLNVPFVLLLQQYGVDKFVHTLRSLGLTTIDRSGDHYGLSLILGGAEVTLYEITSLYSRLSAALSDDEPSEIGRAAFHHTYDAMRHVSRPDEFGGWRQYETSRQIAWKTGTSYGHRDAWAVGCTPSHTIGVWVGNADGEGRDQLTGVTMAGQTLFEVLDMLPIDAEWYPIPYADLDYRAVCSASGMLPSQACMELDTVLLSEVSERTATCPYHRTILVDEQGDYRLHRGCDDGRGRMESYFVLPPSMAYYYRQLHSDYRPLPPYAAHCDMDASEQSMEIIYPYQGEQIYVARDFDGEGREIVIRLSHRRPETPVFWYMDEEYLGETVDFHTMSVRPRVGEHQLSCIDRDGQRVDRRFVVVNDPL